MTPAVVAMLARALNTQQKLVKSGLASCQRNVNCLQDLITSEGRIRQLEKDHDNVTADLLMTRHQLLVLHRLLNEDYNSPLIVESER